MKTRGLMQVLKGIFPKKISSSHKAIIKQILNLGHGLYLHGGLDHGKWIYSYDRMNYENILNEVKGGISKFRILTNKYPTGFCAPGFRYDVKLLKILDSLNIKFACDMPGRQPFYPKINGYKSKCLQIPVNKKLNIESQILSGRNDSQIFDLIKSAIEKERFLCLYGHAVFEALNKTDLLIDILNEAERNNFSILTCDEICKLQK